MGLSTFDRMMGWLLLWSYAIRLAFVENDWTLMTILGVISALHMLFDNVGWLAVAIIQRSRKRL